MKHFTILVLLATLATSLAYANSDAAQIGPLPIVQNASSMLKKSLHSLKMRVESDAKNCLENAKGMDATGEYNALHEENTR
jgi:hypothetical protein